MASAVSAVDGPISMNANRPRPASAAMPASKFTGSRRWRSQYSTVPRSAGRATVPVTLETTVILGSPNVTPSRTSRNGSRTGSISGECAATDTPSGVNLTPCAVSCAPTAASAAGSPDSTHCCGEFIEAMARSGRPASSGATAPAGAPTAAIAPGRERSWASRARAAVTRTPSASGKTPATVAATSSPVLCPISACGRMPQDIHRCASAYSSVNSAGWV